MIYSIKTIFYSKIGMGEWGSEMDWNNCSIEKGTTLNGRNLALYLQKTQFVGVNTSNMRKGKRLKCKSCVKFSDLIVFHTIIPDNDSVIIEKINMHLSTFQVNSRNRIHSFINRRWTQQWKTLLPKADKLADIKSSPLLSLIHI